ncbi:anti-sigma factor domain-containing protein [Streptomyces bauhiniae]|uniref:Anti-sigma factor n=1 Tax=Streptomyces bauhiniae TaxID=2340725 RepID=A0A7K3QVM6_9ACTN|nr:anti-sigma factor [Streptomyces bauhiniae]
MKHADEETLLLMALGELPATSDSLHLRTCSTCQRELESFRRVVRTAQAPEPAADLLLQPPPGLWTDIAAELSLEERHLTPEVAVDDELHAIITGQRAGKQPTFEPAARPPVPVPPGRARRRMRFSVALAACAALLGAAAGSTVTWWVTRDGSTPSVAGGKPLDSLRAASTGYASLRGTPAHRSLTVDVKGLPSTSGYFEVWLMNSSHTKLVSMGVLDPDGKATLPVPENIDLGEYSVVDVSVQPYNGKPDHSGKSIVRGPYAG